MSKNCTQSNSPLAALKNEATRKRWELFHLAIAHAKKSNLIEMQEADAPSADAESSGPMLSIAR